MIAAAIALAVLRLSAGPAVEASLRDAARDAAATPRPGPPGMVRLPALALDIGSTDGEIAGAFAWCRTLTAPAACRRPLYERERPVHRVQLSALWLDARERSTAELAGWLSGLAGLREDGGWVVADGARLAQVGEERDLRWRGTVVARPGTERLPAVDVTYDGARRFCRDQGMDLPTEAQWERAARGAQRRRFPWGELAPTCDRAIYGRGTGGPCGPGGRLAVDAETLDRTPEGIANLGGNVAEWVVDRYADGGYAACPAPCADPVAANTSDPHEPHVIRGGSFDALAEQVRAAGRSRAPRDAAFGNVGFRCAMPDGPEDR